MTYNRDLQEDKERLFDTADTVRATVRLMAAMMRNVKVNRDTTRAAAADPGLLATDLADYLVRHGVPFRKAHHAVGGAVALAEQKGKKLNDLTTEELQSVEPTFGADVFDVFRLEKALESRVTDGAPGPALVKKQLARWKKRLE